VIVERPEYLALAPLAALLFALALGAHWHRLRRLAKAYELPALRRLLPVRVDRFPTTRLLLFVGSGVLLGLGIAGPVWMEPERPEPPDPLDIAIVVDMSLSMTADDVSRSRIERARTAIELLTDELPSVRFSLMVFSGWPYVLVPPTDDRGIIRYFIDSLQPELVQEGDRGNSLAAALELAGSTLASRPRPNARKAILVISDGDLYEDRDAAVKAASEAEAGGFEVWVAGVGTEEGVPLSVGGELVRDAGGQVVRVGQEVDLLRVVADAGGGTYEDITEEAGLRSLVSQLQQLSGDSDEGPAEPFDTTYLLALLAIPLLLWEGFIDSGRAA